jgi:Skp family chaperone for outer membrane proteins
LIKSLKFTLFLLIFFTTKSILATNIVTVDIEYILNNSTVYKSFLDLLSDKKIELSNKLEKDELSLIEEKNNIDNYSLILNEEEINLKIIKYNKELNIYKSKLDFFNEYLNNNITQNQQIIINIIQEIAEEYSLNNNIEIVLDENNYFISTQNIDISNYIIAEIEKKDIKIDIID